MKSLFIILTTMATVASCTRSFKTDTGNTIAESDTIFYSIGIKMGSQIGDTNIKVKQLHDKLIHVRAIEKSISDSIDVNAANAFIYGFMDGVRHKNEALSDSLFGK